MSAIGATHAPAAPAHAASDTHTHRSPLRRLAETKASVKTTEFFAFLAVLAGILISAAVVGDGGANDGDVFPADQAWLYATILTSGYLISRGLAKSGSPQSADDDRW
jgi:hypothetical protein